MWQLHLWINKQKESGVKKESSPVQCLHLLKHPTRYLGIAWYICDFSILRVTFHRMDYSLNDTLWIFIECKSMSLQIYRIEFWNFMNVSHGWRIHRILPQRHIPLNGSFVDKKSKHVLFEEYVAYSRLHRLEGGSTWPRYSLFCFYLQEKNQARWNETSFIQDKCCHLTLYLHLMEPHWKLKRLAFKRSLNWFHFPKVRLS